MPACTVDGRETELRLCNGCLDALKAELRAIPDLVAQLDITLTRQARIGERNGPRSTETPLPFHAGASVDLETILTTLSIWAQTLAKTGARLDVGPDSVELSKWFLRNTDSIARHEDAAELVENVHSMTLAAHRTIDLAPDRRFLGPCDECKKDLYIWWRPTDRLPETVHCHTEDCDTSYPFEERRLWLLEHAYNQLLTAYEMSRAVGELVPGQTRPITANVISQWASRGLSTPEGREQLAQYPAHPDNPRWPRYLVSEVIRFARLAMDNEKRKRTA